MSPAESQPACAESTAPTDGREVAELAAFDAWMTAFMAEHGIPGGALAIVRDGQLVYSRGFGWADREAQQPAEPDSLFRIASVSKSITAVAILKLADEGKLKLEDKILEHLHDEPHFEREDGEREKHDKVDPRWQQVTIAHCLAHTGGWDRDQSYDPMFQALRMSRSLKTALPILPEQIIRFQLGQPLDFDPGSRYAYSNFGYSLLGRVIEKVTGQPYEVYVRQAVLLPLGITRAQMGGSLPGERIAGEVRYYAVNEGRGTATVGPGAGEASVPIPYGVWRQQTLDSHGGWIASAPDLARFAAAFDLVENGTRPRSPLLKAETVRLMFAPHADILSSDDKSKVAAHYGYGWNLKEEPGQHPTSGSVARHGGALACTAASLMHFTGNVNLAVLFNLGQDQEGKFLGRRIEGPLTELVRGVEEWPALKP